MNFRILHFTVLVISLMIFTSCLEKDNTELIEQHKRLAGELRDSKLYEGAIEEYQKILKFNSIDVRTRANINYLIGKIYFENLNLVEIIFKESPPGRPFSRASSAARYLRAPPRRGRSNGPARG